MMRKIFILIPSLSSTGPIKGAVALANALVGQRQVTLVVLKQTPGANAPLDSRVEMISFAGVSSWRGKVKSYRQLLKSAGGRKVVASVSYCLSADAVNLLCRREALIVSSVRGNLPVNYRMDYGFLGLLIATGHLFSLRWFDHVVVMTKSMGRQVTWFSGAKSLIVGNFVDEVALEHYRFCGERKGPLRFIFVGSLSARKCPHLLLHAAAKFKHQGIEFRIDLLGEGPLRSQLESLLDELDIGDVVQLHGNQANPYTLVAKADCMVLPSLSEGVSRAVLESLYLGVPCLLRDVDGNKELIESSRNGLLFGDDGAIPEAMLKIANESRLRTNKADNLLPVSFRQQSSAQQYLTLMEN